MATYISNAFSLNMLGKELSIAGLANIQIIEITSISDIKQFASNAISVVGHKDTAAIFSNILGMDIAENRVSLSLELGDQLLVGQYIGQRLPEGTTVLPEGSRIVWLLVSVG